jgi:hypothetical protein
MSLMLWEKRGAFGERVQSALAMENTRDKLPDADVWRPTGEIADPKKLMLDAQRAIEQDGYLLLV